MLDQANQLRKLARLSTGIEDGGSAPRPALVVVAGGKGGVGVTTVAVHLAMAAARLGRSTLLVDADPQGGDVATLCGLRQRYNLADVLCLRRTLREALQPGPGGVSVLPGCWGWAQAPELPPQSDQRLLAELAKLESRADLVLVDAGSGGEGTLRRFWQAADLVLVVTTPEAPAILDTYAAIKTLTGQIRTGPIRLLVNRADDALAAEQVAQRIGYACRRFLAVDVDPAGHLPDDPQLAATADSPTARPLDLVAAELPSRLETFNKTPISERILNFQASGADME